MIRKWVLGICLIAVSSFANDISVMGLNEKGDEVITQVSREKYVQGMVALISAVESDAATALSRIERGKKWKVRTVSLGIGVDMKLGFPPFFELGIAPRFNTIFSNSKKPVIP